MTHMNEYTEQFKDHMLVLELDAGGYRAVYLSKTGTRQGSVRIVQTPEGIVILGDLAPTSKGVMTSRYYPLDWFAGPPSREYFAKKFLHECYCPRRARRVLGDHALQVSSLLDDLKSELNNHLAEGRQPPQSVIDHLRSTAAQLDRTVRVLESAEITFEAMGEYLGDGGMDTWDVADGTPGWGYGTEDERDLLDAIQCKFAGLWTKRG